MKSSKGNTQEEEEEFEDDFTSKKDGTSGNKDAKHNDKANAMRSKHSVTEQRRRCKINERFQILRDLVPHGDQKRDTSSFLSEVIDYVQLLQEKVQNYEGSYHAWSTEVTEPTKLKPWRPSHWRVQSFLGHPQATKNGPGSATALMGKLDEKSVSINPSVTVNAQTTADADSNHDAFRFLDQQFDLGEKVAAISAPFQVHMPTPAVVQSDGDGSLHPQRPTSNALSSSCALSDDQLGEHMIEGGTISISSAYSHGLLTTLTQALQSSGVDLSKADISIRIDLGKRAKQSLVSDVCGSKDEEKFVSQDLKIGHVSDGSIKEEDDQPQPQPHKKLKY